tara:strand:+ start:436 stop:999 length:564 start_codon:yes stop_codon:yes gene_type:complete
MKLKLKSIILLIALFIIPSAKSAETIFLYQGTLNRTIKIEDLSKFKETKKPNTKLKNILKITNQNEKDLFDFLSYEIDVPLKATSKLMNSKIGVVFLKRLSKIIHPNKISDKSISAKAMRSGIILSSYNNNEKINLIDFFKAYPNKNIAINLNALRKTLKKAESLKELIDFYSNSPFKKLKDGRSNT